MERTLKRLASQRGVAWRGEGGKVWRRLLYRPGRYLRISYTTRETAGRALWQGSRFTCSIRASPTTPLHGPGPEDERAGQWQG